MLADAERRSDNLRYRLESLDREQTHTVWDATAVGQALQAWKTVHYEHNTAERRSHDAPLLRRPGFARQARDAARREAPLEAAYRDLAATARQELLPQLSEATTTAADLDERVLAHRRFMRIDHPEVPRRLAWLEREMGKLDGEVSLTRSELEKAVGAEWALDDPSWAPSPVTRQTLVGQSFPVDIRDALARDAGTGREPQAPRRAHIERDLGPDLGLGL